MTRSWTAAVLASALLVAPGASAKPRQLLFFTKSSGYEHEMIKTKDGQPSVAQKVLEELGARNGFEVTHSKDGRIFDSDAIGKFDGFIFYTLGDLTTEGLDKNPPMSAAGKQVLLDSVKQGKGFIGIHSAPDTFLSPGDRFTANGDDADPYIKMLGGEFIRHGQEQKARVFCADPKFPGFAGAKDGFSMMEEWYSFKNLAKDNHVLLWIATWGMMNTGRDSVYRRAPYPVAWVRPHGKGRVFFTALGHRADVWANPMFQEMLVGGIKWATGEVKASTKPNITTVTPYYDEIPPQDAPRPPPKPAPDTPAAAQPPAAQK
jgi:type 1 glutamine amidotransferase